MKKRDAITSMLELRGARKDAKRAGMRLPIGLRSKKMPQGDWWSVSGKDGAFRRQVEARNAYDAKVELIEKLIKEKNERTLP